MKYFGSYDELGNLQGEFSMGPASKFKGDLTTVVRDRAGVGLKAFDLDSRGNIIPNSVYTISYT